MVVLFSSSNGSTRLALKEIFSPSNKIHREVGQAKDLSAPLYNTPVNELRVINLRCPDFHKREHDNNGRHQFSRQFEPHHPLHYSH